MPFPHESLAAAQAYFNQHLGARIEVEINRPNRIPILHNAIEALPSREHPYFVSELFWSVLIDQVMHSIYMEQHPSQALIYDAFNQMWPSPKLVQVVYPHNICADWLVLTYGGAFGNMMQVLREDKCRLWDREVKPWLKNQLGEGGWRPYHMYTAFLEELNTRGYMRPLLGEQLFPD